MTNTIITIFEKSLPITFQFLSGMVAKKDGYFEKKFIQTFRNACSIVLSNIWTVMALAYASLLQQCCAYTAQSNAVTIKTTMQN